MPWKAEDVGRHNKTAAGSKTLRGLWLRVANGYYKDHGESKAANAIRIANHAVQNAIARGRGK